MNLATVTARGTTEKLARLGHDHSPVHSQMDRHQHEKPVGRCRVNLAREGILLDAQCRADEARVQHAADDEYQRRQQHQQIDRDAGYSPSVVLAVEQGCVPSAVDRNLVDKEEAEHDKTDHFMHTAIAYTFIILLNLVRLPDCAGEGCFWGRRYRGGAWPR